MQRWQWFIVSTLLLSAAAQAGGIELQKLKLDDGEMQYLLQLPTATGGRKQPGLPHRHSLRRAAQSTPHDAHPAEGTF